MATIEDSTMLLCQNDIPFHTLRTLPRVWRAHEYFQKLTWYAVITRFQYIHMIFLKCSNHADAISRMRVNSLYALLSGVDYTEMARAQATDPEMSTYCTDISGLVLEDIPFGTSVKPCCAMCLLVNHVQSSQLHGVDTFLTQYMDCHILQFGLPRTLFPANLSGMVYTNK